MQGFSRRVLVFLVSLSLSMPVYALAASPDPDPPAIENADVGDPVDIEDEGYAEDDDEMGILINDIHFDGNTVVSTQTLRELTADFRGKLMSLQDMGDLTDLITMTYQEKGYILARAYLPEQEIAEGVLKISIAEGKVGKLKVVGQKYYKPDVIKRYFLPQKKHGVIREELLEEGIVLTSRMPDIRTGIVLKESETPGATDIILKASESPALTLGIDASIDYNNQGSKTMGADRYALNIDLVEHEFGSKISLKGSTGNVYDESHVFSVGWKIPLFSYGSNLLVNYFQGSTFLEQDYSAFSADLKNVPANSSILAYGFQFSHPLVKRRSTAVNFALGYDYKIFKAFVTSDPPLFQDKIDERKNLKAQLNFENTDRFLGRNFGTLEYINGALTPEVIKPKNIDSIVHTRSGSDTNYNKYVFQLGRIQKVYGYTNLMVRASGQYSDNSLTSTEQFGIGGYYTIRGQSTSSKLGDSGYATTAELIFAPPFLGDKLVMGQRLSQMIQMNAFFDHGGAFINDPQAATEYESEYLSGYGAGIRFAYKNKFSFKYTFSVPVDVSAGQDSKYHYFETSYSFF
jgi:hemolysin activation/secretion protein